MHTVHTGPYPPSRAFRRLCPRPRRLANPPHPSNPFLPPWRAGRPPRITPTGPPTGGRGLAIQPQPPRAFAGFDGSVSLSHRLTPPMEITCRWHSAYLTLGPLPLQYKTAVHTNPDGEGELPFLSQKRQREPK